MEHNFKIGDFIIVNPEGNEGWEDFFHQVMEIEKVTMNFIQVKENDVIWYYKNVLPYKMFDFELEDKDFEI